MKKLLLLTLLTLSCITHADVTHFADGPLIKGFGKHAKVDNQFALNTNAVLKVAFDLEEQGGEEKVNKRINSLARFLNMHVASGFKPENIQLALVVHGKAGYDLLNNKAYEEEFLRKNPNDKLLTELLKNNVKIYLCGQSARYYDIENKHLHKGAKMALSAMTTHAFLQQQGYTLNPF